MEQPASSPETSRPSSPAQSDATEVPDFHSRAAPRTVATDIEHIKALISRADGVGKAPEHSITAQVFRSRSGSTGSAGPVSQQRIFHELDLLKKRIRNEQQHVRRPSQMDPETESESEAIDEREEELENIREQLHLERQQSEDLLANAEGRIDGLMKEKDDLAKQLGSNKDDLARVQEELQEAKDAHTNRLSLEEQERESLREQLKTQVDLHQQRIQSAEARIAQMEQEIVQVEQRAQAAETAAKQRETEMRDELAAKEHELADVQGHLAELQHKVYEQSAELQGKNAELSEATEHAYRMYDERDNAYQDELQELRDQHAAALSTQGDAHSVELKNAHAAHEAELARLRTEHERTLGELEQGWSSKAEAAAQSHQAELSSAQSEYQEKLARLGADSDRRAVGMNGNDNETSDSHEQLQAELEATHSDLEAIKAKLAAAQEQNWKQLMQFQEKHARTVASHASETIDLETEHRRVVDDLETQNAELERQVNDLKTLHRELSQNIEPVNGDDPVENAKALGFLKECTRQLQKVHEAEVERLRNGYDRSMRELESNSAAELEGLRHALGEALEISRTEGRAALDSVHMDQEELKRALETKLDAAEKQSKAQLVDLNAQHQKVIQNLELSRLDDLESVRQEHERAVRMLLRNHKHELNSAEETHQQQLSDLATSLQSQREPEDVFRSSELASRHQKALESAIEEAHQSSQAEMVALRKTHKRELSRAQAEAEKDLASALANADEDLEERLRIQSQAHRKELDQLNESLNVELTHLHLKLEEASQVREEQMQEVEQQHHAELQELRLKIEAAEQTTTALQARLEAESMGRAEAERSLAGYKRQRYSETPAESKATLRRSIIVLEAERDNLARQLAGSPTSTDSEVPEGLRSPPSENMEAVNSDSLLLKQRLAVAERERDEAQTAADRKIDEMTRQTDFLVKELELAMARRSAERVSHLANVDVSVQTDAVMVIDPNLLEPKADAAMSKEARLQRPDLRRSRSVTDTTAEVPDKRRSFEDYLQQAQAELSDLGSVTNINETLFAEKTKEHAAVLQSTKEQLATEYHRKFRALQMEKERMDRAVAAKSAADFTREHVDLFASYGISHEESAKQAAMYHNLPARKKKAIRLAEQGLVAEYQRRLTKRKSQIAMKHAEKFHSLTRDFHQKNTDITNGTEAAAEEELAPPKKWESGRESVATTASRISSVPAGHSRQASSKTVDGGAGPLPLPPPPSAGRDSVDRSQLENALRAAATTLPKSQLPKRISISAPRTATSIPRAVPFSGRTPSEVSTRSPRTPASGDGLAAASTPDTTSINRPAAGTTALGKDPSSVSLAAREETLNQLAPLDKAETPSPAPSLSATPKTKRRTNYSSRTIFQNA